MTWKRKGQAFVSGRLRMVQQDREVLMWDYSADRPAWASHGRIGLPGDAYLWTLYRGKRVVVFGSKALCEQTAEHLTNT
jgi:hypothetical protein